MTQAIRIIQDEHRSISEVLIGLKALARMALDSRLPPAFEAGRAMVDYIDKFPERMHHPKEDKYLFTTLVQRSPEARALVEELRAEHVASVGMVRNLAQALRAFEGSWPDGAAAFAATVDTYAQFHWRHMRSEEQRILPLSVKVLTLQDWMAIGTAFAANDDPIAGLRETYFAKLHSSIGRMVFERRLRVERRRAGY